MKLEGRAGLWILAGVGAILLTAALSWFFSNFERRSIEVESGYSAAARRNPFLAAERFLALLDISVESLAGRELLRNLPPPGDTLVVNGLGVLNRERQEALHQWIEQGGRLIVKAQNPWDEADGSDRRGGDFLGRYGVRLRESPDAGDPFEPDEQLIAAISIDDFPYQLEVGFAARHYLEDASETAHDRVAAGEFVRLLKYEFGDGLLTVISDNRFLTNSHIGGNDHALFLALLASPGGERKVWLLYDSGMPWLGALLWRRAPFALVSSLCLLLLFLWHLGGRLGPLLPIPVGDRRNLLAHLQASANFLWYQGLGRRITDRSRQRIERAWVRRHPALREMEQSERAAWIARRAGIAPGDVGRVLYPTAVSESELVADAVLLQRLWSRLLAPRRQPALAIPNALRPPRR